MALNTIATTRNGGIQVQGRDIWPSRVEMVADGKNGDPRIFVKMEFHAHITSAVAAPCPYPMG